ncbi:MAG: hypothetical protein CSB21_03405 [Deltaproteobacteria bacterium]|nr:MAG: hypothetical protein CSB21_03405 [Deltaproteobacteria bacterium]
MTNKELADKIIDSHMECFGEFDSKDSICKKNCVLNIRCCIEKSRLQRLLFSDEFFGNGSNAFLIQ